MSYYKKYIKYKSKYLNLKNKINQIGGKIIKTIPNSGMLEGMTLQCFWISILQYLKKPQNPPIQGRSSLTLRDLRSRAGLDSRSEHIMFDTWATNKEGRLYFIEAADRIAHLYHINIQVYIANRHRDGTIHINEQPTYFFPMGEPVFRYSTVRLVNFGIHFELIDDKGSDYVPLVSYKGTATKITEVPVNEQELYLRNSEDALLLKTFEHQKKEIEKKYIEELDSINKLTEMRDDEKEALRKQTKSKIELDNITKIIKEVKERIKKEEHDIKQIELSNLQDILTQQQKHLKEEQDLYTSLIKTSDLNELNPLKNIISEIQQSIKETEQTIAIKKKEL
jgi:hypothetical protein